MPDPRSGHQTSETGSGPALTSATPTDPNGRLEVVTYRAAVRDDAARITSIGVKAGPIQFTGAANPLISDEMSDYLQNWDVAKIQERIEQANRRLIVACDVSNKAVGFSELVLGEDCPLPAGSNNRACAAVDSVYVDPGLHRRGIRSALVEKTIEEARKNGTAQLWLMVLDTNVPACQLYLKHGFVVTGHTGFPLESRVNNHYIMVKELDHEAS